MPTLSMVAACWMSLVGAKALAVDVVTLGVVPTRGAVAMERTFGSMAKVVDEAIPQTVLFRTRASYEEFLVAFNDREFDIAVIHPFDFFRSTVQDEYLPLVRMAGELQAIFVTTDADIKTLTDLRGKKIAFPRSKSRGTIPLLGRYRLQAAGLMDGDYQTVEHGNFAACLQSLINASVDACLTLRNTIREFTRNRQINIRVIAETESIPHVAFFLHKDFQQHEEALRAHLLSLNNTEEGRILLHLFLLDKLQSFTSADLQAVRQHPFYRELQTQDQ